MKPILNFSSRPSHILSVAALLLGLFSMISLAPIVVAQTDETQEAAAIIEGDVLSISFPAAGELNTSQKVRRDGRITLPLVGEVVVAGLTPTELETALLALYDKQLVTKEVSVSITSSSYAFYVNGAVLRAGKQMSDRSLTALEAIMEAGGPSPSANLKKVTVLRREGEDFTLYKINLKDVLSGKKKGVFQIQPADIITVPEKFVIF